MEALAEAEADGLGDADGLSEAELQLPLYKLDTSVDVKYLLSIGTSSIIIDAYSLGPSPQPKNNPTLGENDTGPAEDRFASVCEFTDEPLT